VTYLARAQVVPKRLPDEDTAVAGDVCDVVDDVFPGSRLTARRTSKDFTRYWDELGRRHLARKRAETIAASRLEQLQEQTRHTPVATTEATR
jgi:hypothetical protein